LTLAADRELFDRNPRGFHLTNLLLHLLNALLVFALATRCLRQKGTPATAFAALFAAALFSLHPLRVESVAWITQRRDLLGATFSLLSVLAYLRAFDRASSRGRPLWFSISLAFLTFALLSKASGVSVVPVLLVIDAAVLRRFDAADRLERRRVLVEKIPFVLLALAAAIAAPLAQRATGAMVPLADQTLFERLLVLGYGVPYYLYKTVWPSPLSPLYELPLAIDVAQPRFLLGALASSCFVATLVWAWRRGGQSSRAYAAAAASYLFVLLPVLGLLQSGPQLVADRYSYLATVGWAILAAGVLRPWLENGARRLVAGTVAVGFLAFLAVTTSTYSRIWQTSQTLWRRALSVDPTCGYCAEGLAETLIAKRQIDEAIAVYRQGLFHRPNLPRAHLGLSLLLERSGELTGALEHARRFASLSPDSSLAYRHLGKLYAAAAGDLAQAEEALRHALGLAPATVSTYLDLAALLVDQDRCADALAVLTAARSISSSDPRLEEELEWLALDCEALTTPETAGAAEQ
jgi:hypothetical protein